MSDSSLSDRYRSIPELMRRARGSYLRSIRERYAACGIDDVPAPGGYVIGYIAGGEDSIPELMSGLGISERTYNDLVDTLVLRGFIIRTAREDGGSSFALTERGQEAADAMLEGSRIVDEELERRLTASELSGLRKGLAVLADIKSSYASH